eukprot:CAMPEP_0184709218 /NCGR_PEP_ID=MMETSP0314-20130426/418_1 /TAXON_ID=38298 /ORGANISM="Rhodella maculata, Strain CCMP 736" /LENGTH=119 /DNA_ID=CAMNT_0027170887 /DNA_START=10 /DNA_END=367 /DNA_ORIENTATION=-
MTSISEQYFEKIFSTSVHFDATTVLRELLLDPRSVLLLAISSESSGIGLKADSNFICFAADLRSSDCFLADSGNLASFLRKSPREGLTPDVSVGNDFERFSSGAGFDWVMEAADEDARP